MADSILCSINMAGGAINIYYDTILAQGSVEGSVALPSNWKVVIITSARYQRNSQETLIFPFPIFTNNINDLMMPAIDVNGQLTIFNFVYISSNTLHTTGYVNASYIAAG